MLKINILLDGKRMEAIAGNGVCVIKSSKVRILKNSNNELYCMFKGKRYILDKKKLPKNGYTDVTLTRGRKKKSYGGKTNSRRKRRSLRLPRSSFKNRRSLSKKECNRKLSAKIAINIKEFKKGTPKAPKNRSQAIAISYSQIKKQYPECKRFFR